MIAVHMYFFLFNDTATTEIYTLSLHDALPIFSPNSKEIHGKPNWNVGLNPIAHRVFSPDFINACSNIFKKWLLIVILRSEEHTSELQSRLHLVCRLLLEKKKKHMQQPQDFCV